jgi:hypothetical protein
MELKIATIIHNRLENVWFMLFYLLSFYKKVEQRPLKLYFYYPHVVVIDIKPVFG